MNRLNDSTLAGLPAGVSAPDYDRAALRAGIAHLGIGAFHRAHQAVYIDETIARQGGGDWGIIACSLRSPATAQRLNPQNGLYSVLARDNDNLALRVVGSVLEVVFAGAQPRRIIDLIADSAIKIVSLTITEKGYCHDPATGDLATDHPAIERDLAAPDNPHTALGFLSAGLVERRRRGGAGLALLSCDNLPGNGRVLKHVLLQFLDRFDAETARWVESQVDFPCTMVDRIVPATTEEDRALVARKLRARDEGVVVTEPFSQWVIEDRFRAGRPRWEMAGVQMVEDMTAYEEIKLRFLNGTHSLLAYAGSMAGYDYIADVMRCPEFAALARAFMDSEVQPTVTVPASLNLDDYKAQLLARFANRALKHRTRQIAMDGSQKIPQRWLKTLREQLRRGGPIDWLSFALACWIRYVSGMDERGNAIAVSDPMAERLREIGAQHQGDAGALAGAFLALEEIFGTDLKAPSRLRNAIADWLRRLEERGTQALLREHRWR